MTGLDVDTWACELCETVNAARAEFCAACHSARRPSPLSTDAAMVGTVTSVAKPGSAAGGDGPSWTCGICDTVNGPLASVCIACKEPMAKGKAASARPPRGKGAAPR